MQMVVFMFSCFLLFLCSVFASKVLKFSSLQGLWTCLALCSILLNIAVGHGSCWLSRTWTNSCGKNSEEKKTQRGGNTCCMLEVRGHKCLGSQRAQFLRFRITHPEQKTWHSKLRKYFSSFWDPVFWIHIFLSFACMIKQQGDINHSWLLHWIKSTGQFNLVKLVTNFLLISDNTL